MYARTSFRGCKNMQNWKKKKGSRVFGHIDKFWKGNDGQIKKNDYKNTYLGYNSHLKNTCFGCVLKVLLRG